MGMRSPFDKINKERCVDMGGNPNGATELVDLGLGEAYEVVKYVHDNLGAIQALSALATQIDEIGYAIEHNVYALADHNHDQRYSLIGHQHVLTDVTGLVAALAGKQAAGSYAPLAHTHLIADVAGLQAALDTKQGAGNYQAAGNYATLVGGLIPTSQLPALAITKPNLVSSQAQQLALVAEQGDLAIRSDIHQTYMHNGGTSGTMADWTQLQTPTDVVGSVNGQTGTIVLGKADVGLGNVDNTSDANKPVSTAVASALALKEGVLVAGTTNQYYRGDKTWQTHDKASVGLGNVDNTSDANKPVSTAQAAAIALKLDASLRAAANGVAPLGSDSKVPSAYLPAAGPADISASSIDALADVDTTTTAPVNGYRLTWNSTTGRWEPAAQAAGVTTIAALTDVGVSGVSNNQFLRYNLATTKWVPATMSMSYISDVDVATNAPTNGQTLVWNSTSNKWVPGTVSGGGGSGTAPTNKGAWALTVTNYVYDFEDGNVPAAFTQTNALSVVTDSDTSGTKSITFSGGAVADWSDHDFSFPVFCDGTHSTVTIRMKIQCNYTTGGANEGVILYVDGVSQGQVVQTLSNETTYTDRTITGLSAGVHTIRVNFHNSAYSNVGAQNIFISQITAPLQTSTYVVGDIVTNGGRTWQCLVSGTAQTPSATSTDWSPAREKIRELLDYDDTTAPTDGQAIVYNTASGKFKPSTVASGGGSASAVRPTVVQQTGVIGQTVTLAAAPTAGNLLVAIMTHWDNAAATATGWNTLYRTNGASFDGVIIATRVVVVGDTAAQTPITSASSGANIVMFEVANAGSLYVPANAIQEQVGAAKAINYGVMKNTSLLLGAASTISANAGPSSVTGATAGTTVQGTSGSASPRQVTPFTANVESGGGTITATYAASATQYIGIVVIDPVIAASANNAGPAQVSARYWRLRFLTLRTDNSSTAASGLSEFAFKDANGTTISTGGTAICSSSQGTNTPDKAFDGSNSTAWYTTNGRNIGEWIGYDFGSAKTPTTFSVIADPGFLTGMPLNFAIDYSSDAVEWFNHSSYSSGAWVANVAQTFNLPAMTVMSNKPWDFKPPKASDFLLMQGTGEAVTAILADDTDVGMTFDYGSVNGSSRLRAAYKTLPATGNWTVTMKAAFNLISQNYSWGGLFAINTGNGNYVSFGPTMPGGNYTRRGDTVGNSYRYNTDEAVPIGRNAAWIRMSWDDTAQTLTGSVSADGKTWSVYFIDNIATSVLGTRPDRIAIGLVNTYNNTARKQLISVSYWNQTW